MARKRASTSQRNASEVAWGGFVDIRLTEEQKEQFTLWSTTPDCDLQLDVQEALGAGLKLGVTYNPDNDFYLATYTGSGKAVIGLENRYCLTARAPTYPEAIALLNFKHFVLCECNWADYQPRTQQMERFG